MKKIEYSNDVTYYTSNVTSMRLWSPIFTKNKTLQQINNIN